jgi:outer membrane protein assembly factor BamB
MKKGGGYPYLLALDITNGNLIWGKRVEAHIAGMLTMSPTVHAGYIYQVRGRASCNNTHMGNKLLSAVCLVR